uniref:Uncharacterized protein n=1 Tax=Plocamium cartilagineum TaxID=31452 RepID=A0A1C9CHM9_PLOCA|nr:hypothetical protein Plocam_060 [Plocamium cartilagineum]AOM67896.1 hypothetical protein Plocam_060 [Plocamium cartilagineum]
MESLDYILGIDNLNTINELSAETPIGWSSTCLDQTINYYIDCNSIISDEIEKHNQEEK